MKSIINVSLNTMDEKYRYRYTLNDALGAYNCDYEFNINSNVDEKLEELINNKKEILNDLKKFTDEYSNEFDEDIQMINQYINNEIDIIDDISYIEINLLDSYKKEYDEKDFYIVKKYIEANKEFLKDKRVIISLINNISETEKEKVDKFFGMYDNIYYFIEGNSVPISHDEYCNTDKKIDKILNKVKEKNLSPLENLMYLYDLLRNREYKKTESLEEYNKSSDLTSVLSGDYIVCSGFTELFDHFSNKLGFNTYKYMLEGKENNAHIRNLIYVNDPKYNVDGLYFFDVTWDCKKNGNNDFLYSYKYFMKTKDEMEKYDNIKYKVNEFFSVDNELIEKIKQYDNLSFEDLLEIRENLFTSIEIIYQLLKKGDKNDNINLFSQENLTSDNIVCLIEEYLEKINKSFELEKFCELLYNVRKIQNQENPELYPFNDDVIKQITINSKIDNEMTREEKLLRAIFGENEDYQEKIEKIDQKIYNLSLNQKK